MLVRFMGPQYSHIRHSYYYIIIKVNNSFPVRRPLAQLERVHTYEASLRWKQEGFCSACFERVLAVRNDIESGIMECFEY